MRKIICLGFQKTGTTSLDLALRRLGYSVGFANVLVNASVKWKQKDVAGQVATMTINHAQKFDAIQDMPCAFLYKELDTAFPESKFILTIRDTDKWMASYQKFFPDKNNNLRKWMYGVDQFSGHETTYRAVFEQQNAKIIDYFKDRPEDFLLLDLAKGDGWLKLVDFLGEDMQKPFPHANPSRKWWNSLKNRHRKYVITRFFYVITIILLLVIWAYQ